MCTLAIAFQHHPRYPLVVVANRDEFYDRPTDRAGLWADQPELFGGRDRKAGGTWMALHRNGRFATLTNYRDPHNIRPDAPSRGALVTEFLLGTTSVSAYLQRIAPTASQFNGFNLLVSDGQQLGYLSNYDAQGPRLLKPGLYGLSNALLDDPWPKVAALKADVGTALQADRLDPSALISLTDRPETYPDHQLPTTGVPIEAERALSALRIDIPTFGKEGYGTCCSTVVLQTGHYTELLEVNRNVRRGSTTPVHVSLPL